MHTIKNILLYSIFCIINATFDWNKFTFFMKKIIFFTILLGLLSCDSERDSCCTNIDVNLNLLVQNIQGNDLLNSTTTNSLNTDKIQILFVDKNGVMTTYDRIDNFNGNGYEIFDAGFNGKAMKIYLNNDAAIKEPRTIIQWNSVDADTIDCTFSRKNGNIILSSVLINGDIVQEKEGFLKFTK